MCDTRGELADGFKLLGLRDVMLQFDLFGNVFAHEYPAGPITLTQTNFLPVAPALHHADDLIPVPWYRQIGQQVTVNSMENCRWSRCQPSTSIRFPSTVPCPVDSNVRIPRSWASRKAGGMITSERQRPSTSWAVHPKIRSLCGFQATMVPVWLMRMCASNALSKIVCAVAESSANDWFIRLCSMGLSLLRAHCHSSRHRRRVGPPPRTLSREHASNGRNVRGVPEQRRNGHLLKMDITTIAPIRGS